MVSLFDLVFFQPQVSFVSVARRLQPSLTESKAFSGGAQGWRCVPGDDEKVGRAIYRWYWREWRFL